MVQLFPLMIFGGVFLAAKGGKKKSSTFKLIETGSMAMLPPVEKSALTVEIRPRQMIEIIAASAPASNWVFDIDGNSIKVEKKTRMQDAVTQLSTFIIKALVIGDSTVVFKKIGPEGQVTEARHLHISVTG